MIRVEKGLYRSGTFALAADFELNAGSFCAVLGPSGAGKSTLLSVIAGFEPLVSGDVYLDEKNMAGIAPAQRPVSMVFQDTNSFSHLTVWNNVALGISPALKLNAKQSDLVNAALQKAGLVDLKERRPSELSGGERQRIALARMLVRNKPILLLDEPFAALDPALRGEMLDLVLELQREHRLTVLMVTHQPHDAELAADGIVFVSDGIVHQPMNPKAFFGSREIAITNYLGRRG